MWRDKSPATRKFYEAKAAKAKIEHAAKYPGQSSKHRQAAWRLPLHKADEYLSLFTSPSFLHAQSTILNPPGYTYTPVRKSKAAAVAAAPRQTSTPAPLRTPSPSTFTALELSVSTSSSPVSEVITPSCLSPVTYPIGQAAFPYYPDPQSAPASLLSFDHFEHHRTPTGAYWPTPPATALELPKLSPEEITSVYAHMPLSAPAGAYPYGFDFAYEVPALPQPAEDYSLDGAQHYASEMYSPPYEECFEYAQQQHSYEMGYPAKPLNWTEYQPQQVEPSPEWSHEYLH